MMHVGKGRKEGQEVACVQAEKRYTYKHNKCIRTKYLLLVLGTTLLLFLRCDGGWGGKSDEKSWRAAECRDRWSSGGV